MEPAGIARLMLVSAQRRTDFSSPRLNAAANFLFKAASRAPAQGKILTRETNEAANPAGSRVILSIAPSVPPSSPATVSGSMSRPPVRNESSHIERGCVTPALTRIASQGPGSSSPPSPSMILTCDRLLRFSAARRASWESISTAVTCPSVPTTSAMTAV